MKKILMLFIIFLLGITSVYALEGNVTSISVIEKSSTIIVEEPSVTNNRIDAKVTFKNVGDYVIFTLGLDIDSNLYTIESVTDNNESEHIKTTYMINEDKIEMKLEYESALTTSMDLEDIEIIINVKDKEGNTETLIVNPGTGDNIIKYVSIFGISILVLSSLVLLRKKKSVLGVILLIAIIPTIVIAEEKMKLSVELNKDEIKVGYDVVFNGGEGAIGSTETKLCYFGEKCILPTNEFEKESSNFIGWATEIDGKVVYLNEEEVRNLAAGGEVNLFAVWKDYVCKKVTNTSDLHSKICSRTSRHGCNNDGQVGNGRIIRYGTIVNGTPKAGDAYDCKVTVDGDYTERFYYVGSEDSDNSILIYYKNIDDQTTYAYDSSNENWHGPRTAYQYLPGINEWNNPGLIAPGTRQIVAQDGNDYTVGGSIELFSYTEKAARFITYQEIKNACGVGQDYENIKITNCTWLMENVGQYESDSGTFGYLLETPRSSYSSSVWFAFSLSIDLYYTNANYGIGIRPVITVKTSDLG